jgi:hypothetical protein
MKTYVHVWSHWILISGFRRDVDVICGLLGYYTASHDAV